MSTIQRVDVSESVWPDSQILSEIAWCERKIEQLNKDIERRPRVIRQINDLFRQIRDKESVLEFRRKR